MDFVKVKEIVQTASEQNNCRVYDIYKHKDRLQIFIDKKSQLVNLKDCENVFHSLRFLLNSEMPYILENNRLEVSSPGVEKQLRERWHFEESIGETMRLITYSPVKTQNKKTGRQSQTRSLTAQLISIEEESIYLRNSQFDFSIPFSEIKSAKLIFKLEIKKQKVR